MVVNKLVLLGINVRRFHSLTPSPYEPSPYRLGWFFVTGPGPLFCSTSHEMDMASNQNLDCTPSLHTTWHTRWISTRDIY